LTVGSKPKEQQFVQNVILNAPLATKTHVPHAQLDYSIDAVSAQQNANQDADSVANHQADSHQAQLMMKKLLLEVIKKWLSQFHNGNALFVTQVTNSYTEDAVQTSTAQNTRATAINKTHSVFAELAIQMLVISKITVEDVSHVVQLFHNAMLAQCPNKLYSKMVVSNASDATKDSL